MSMNQNKTVDPARVPKKILYNAKEIPAIGMGTFASENYSAEEVAAAVKEAVSTQRRGPLFTMAVGA